MTTIFSKALILAIRLYQKLISPILPRSCRYYPTCSEYAAESIRRHGVIHGTLRAIRRIGRCHPWHDGGYDPVEKQRVRR